MDKLDKYKVPASMPVYVCTTKPASHVTMHEEKLKPLGVGLDLVLAVHILANYNVCNMKCTGEQ